MPVPNGGPTIRAPRVLVQLVQLLQKRRSRVGLLNEKVVPLLKMVCATLTHMAFQDVRTKETVGKLAASLLLQVRAYAGKQRALAPLRACIATAVGTAGDGACRNGAVDSAPPGLTRAAAVERVARAVHAADAVPPDAQLP